MNRSTRDILDALADCLPEKAARIQTSAERDRVWFPKPAAADYGLYVETHKGSGGLLILAFHVGDERLRMERWWDTEASLDFYLHPLERVVAQLRQAGFEMLRTETRQPYGEAVEAQTRRGYIIAKLP